MLLAKIVISIAMTLFIVLIKFYVYSFFRNGALGAARNWMLIKDCVAVHKLLGTILDDHDAASSQSFSFPSCFYDTSFNA